MSIDVSSLYERRADNRWDRCAVGDIFERVASATPDAEAIVGAPGAFGSPGFAQVTYRQADEFANQAANALRARGIARGDRILFVCENSVEALIAKFAVAKLGAVVVPINPNQTRDVMAHAVGLVEPRMVIADAEHGALPAAVGLSVDITIPISGRHGSQGQSFEDFLRSHSPEPPESTIHGDDIWQILFTSGTTAMPKGVMISHSHAYLAAMSYALTFTRGLAHESHLRMACFAPIIFHIGDQAYVMPTFLCGGTTIIGRRYRPADIAAAVADHRATAVIGGGIQLCEKLVDALEEEGADRLMALNFLQFGLGVLPAADRTRLERLCPGISLTLIAGQTEAVGGHRFPANVLGEKYGEVLGNGANIVGRPTTLMESRIVDMNDGETPLAPSETGELVYRSPIMTAGYYRDEAATRSAFANGWFHSGDLGVADADGHRYIVGRLKDVIKTGGENVSGTRVEGILQLHPDIAEVAVIGLPDPIWGEAVTAAVVFEPGVTHNDQALKDFCRQRLAGYEIPKRFISVDALPRDFIGKVRKFALREMLCKEAAS